MYFSSASLHESVIRKMYKVVSATIDTTTFNRVVHPRTQGVRSLNQGRVRVVRFRFVSITCHFAFCCWEDCTATHLAWIIFLERGFLDAEEIHHPACLCQNNQHTLMLLPEARRGRLEACKVLKTELCFVEQ